jgi:hypothetical protein
MRLSISKKDPFFTILKHVGTIMTPQNLISHKNGVFTTKNKRKHECEQENTV